MKMNLEEFDKYIRKNTAREEFYLENPNNTSPLYKKLKKKIVNGKKIIIFEVDKLKSKEISMMRDSRYTSGPFHCHSNVNLNYIYSGKCTYIIDNEELTLYQGDVCIFDKNVVRAKTEIEENDIIFNISMSNDYFSSSLSKRIHEQSILASFIINSLSMNKMHDNYIVFRTGKNDKIIYLFNQVLLEYHNKNKYSKEIIQSYIDIIFIELLRLYDLNHNKHIVKINGDTSNIIFEILNYIESFYNDCTIEKMAKLFGYHPKYLSSLIKEKTGKNFKELQLIQRMNIASSYLKNTNYSIQEISEEVGFSNQTFFYKKFFKFYNMTPKEFRNQKK